MKRKRHHGPENARKRPNTTRTDAGLDDEQSASPVNHPVLTSYYKEVLTLRQFLCLTNSRRRFSVADHNDGSELSKLLDIVLVATNHLHRLRSRQCATQDVAVFSQQLPQSTIGTGSIPHPSHQLEVVDFVVWLLFRRNQPYGKPQHLLCQGFERASAAGQKGLDMTVAPGIPGIICHYPNHHIEVLTSPVWCQLLSTLGRGGDLIMVDLLVECALFYPSFPDSSRLQQLSGIPLTKISPLSQATTPSDAPQTPTTKPSSTISERRLSSIRFVRSRMFYAKPGLNAQGNVRFGLGHIHVFNRFSNCEDEEQTLHVMKYILPRQFGLHNVFTCDTDSKETSQPFQDYTLREREIAISRREHVAALPERLKDRPNLYLGIPRRLRGSALELTRNMRRNHRKCPYVALFRHYCPTNPNLAHGCARSPTDLATHHANVSAFCRAVVLRVFPHRLWGSGMGGEHNRRIIMRNIHRFVQSRKGESLTLHDVLQDIHISAITWLRPHEDATKMCQSDFNKRKEIFAELIYYLFDSFVVPLVRSNFHVTESNVHRNRLFYFRHDVWRQLTEPVIADLKFNMFEEMKLDQARKLLAGRSLGYSDIRLLPKATGFRPIANLRRRMQIWKGGKKILGRSINSILTPAFKILNFEKVRESTY